jgi:hypothetical protein
MARGGSNVCGFSLPTVGFILLAGLAASVFVFPTSRPGFGETDVVTVTPQPWKAASPVGSPPQNKPPGIDAGSHRARCLSGDLGDGDWVKGERACDRATHPVAGCDDPGATGSERAWEFSTSSRERCEARRIDRESLASMLAGKTVAVVGDSSARMVYAAILRAVAEDRDAWRLESTEKHRDWAHKLDGGGVAAFVWAPFVQNVTASLPNLFKGHHSDDNVTNVSPPVRALVMGSALWHELWVNDVDEYAAALKALAEALKGEDAQNGVDQSPGVGAEGADPVGDGHTPNNRVAFWLTPVRTVPSKFTDERKRMNMTPERGDAYARVANKSPVFERTRPSGRTSVVPIDLGRVTSSCGDECTEDGIHYVNEAYDVAVQIIANALAATWTD